MNNTAAGLAAAALASALDQHVAEITFGWEGTRYTVTDLRRLQAAERLDTLPGPLALGVDYMLQQVDQAERNGDKRIQFAVSRGDLGWMSVMPWGCEVLLPEGWMLLPGKGYDFSREDQEQA